MNLPLLSKHNTYWKTQSSVAIFRAF